jgi:hypothetical protein
MSNKTYKELCIDFYKSTAVCPIEWIIDEILLDWTPHEHDGTPYTTEDEFEEEFHRCLSYDMVWNAIVVFEEMVLNADVFPMPKEHADVLLSALGGRMSSDEDDDE